MTKLCGDWETDRSFAVLDPFVNEELARLPVCGSEEVLDRAAVLLREQTEEIAGLITSGTGKTVRELDLGGVEDSGNTREGPAHAVLEMTQRRFVSLGGVA